MTDDNGSGRWIAAGTTIVAATIDLIYGVEASLIVPLVFGPFVASALASVRDTATVAVVATLFGVLLGWTDQTIGTSPHAVRVASVALGGTLAVWLASRRTAREHKLVVMTHVAQVAQQAILRPLPDEIRGIRLAARYVSASEEAQVGGDFYEALETPWGVRLVVGDVRGKGLDAVRLASVLLGEFRSRAFSEADRGRQGRRRRGRSCGRPGWRGLCDRGVRATRRSVGHDRPVRAAAPLLAQRREVHPIETESCLPLCLGTDPAAEEFHLDPGTRILLFSDGATEGRDERGDYFDVQSSYQRHVGAPEPGTVLDLMLGDLDRHCDGGISDDVVLVMAEQPFVRRAEVT